MNHVIDELTKSLKYHKRQLRDNETDMKKKMESVDFLRQSNLQHAEAIMEIEEYLEHLKGDSNE